MLLAENDGYSLKNDPQKQSLQFLKGVGPQRLAKLEALGLSSFDDLIRYFPRDWEDRRLRFTLGSLPLGEKVCVRGTLSGFHTRRVGASLGMAEALLTDASGHAVTLLWFKRLTPRYDVYEPMIKQFATPCEVFVYGSAEKNNRGVQLRVEDWGLANETDSKWHFDRITPLYRSTQGLSDKLLRQLVATALEKRGTIPELLPTSLKQKNNWAERDWALHQIHFPDSWATKEKARQTLAYEEGLLLECALMRLRSQVRKQRRIEPYTVHKNLLTPFREALPFELTDAQKRVIHEIFKHLQSSVPMTRLLQGDVGSGKTVVALCAMLLAVENKGQAALMAPTEILAEQHRTSFEKFLGNLPVRVACLTSRMPKSARDTIRKQLAQGDIDILIGTHALLEEDVVFKSLKVAVIDEQHRFGVRHRSLLRAKGTMVDLLVMTATPIPRTLAMTAYGDLDVSVLDSRPKNRLPIQTQHTSEDKALEAVTAAVALKQQAYIVYPLVEETDKLQLKAVVKEAEQLARSRFSMFKVGTLTGPMKGPEKDRIMKAFARGEIDILIASSIVEVGIDVANATVMVIQHAERFGLATLHQLRGRVGRGSIASRCLLVGDAKSTEAKARLQIMTETNDGFRLSEEDLRLRGPGEVLGVMQHGLPLLSHLNLLTDHWLIQQARADAEQLLASDPNLAHPDHQALRQAVRQNYDSKWSLGLAA